MGRTSRTVGANLTRVRFAPGQFSHAWRLPRGNFHTREVRPVAILTRVRFALKLIIHVGDLLVSYLPRDNLGKKRDGGCHWTSKLPNKAPCPHPSLVHAKRKATGSSNIILSYLTHCSKILVWQIRLAT